LEGNILRSLKFHLTGREDQAILPTMRLFELIPMSVERKVWLWAIIGPLLVLLSASVCALKHGGLGLVLSLAGVVSLPLCFFLHLRGFCLSVLLTLSALLFFGDLAEAWPWIGGVLLSLVIGLLVSTLAAQEFIGELHRLESESESRFQEMVALDLQWKQAEGWWHRREQELAGEVQEAGRLAAMTQDRLGAVAGEVHQCREQIRTLEVAERRLSYERDERASQVQQLRHLANAVRCDLFQARLDLKSRPPVDRVEVSQLRRRLEEAEGQLFAKSYLFDEQEEELRHHQSQLQRKGEQERQLAAQIEAFQKEIADLSQEHLALQEMVAALKPIRYQYEQLRGQFAEKCQVLDETRADLFESQERVLLLERERAEQSLLPSRLEELLADRTAQIEEEREQVEQESERLQELVGNLLNELASRSVLRPDCLNLTP
jgi:hypothetical protein